jgi:hypothetical protein
MLAAADQDLQNLCLETMVGGIVVDFAEDHRVGPGDPLVRLRPTDRAIVAARRVNCCASLLAASLATPAAGRLVRILGDAGESRVPYRATFEGQGMIVPKFWTGATMDNERAWTACVLTLSVLMFFGAIIVGLVGTM